ncbi:MAG: triphosphoribosyl-dephospho-CoA synthase [Thermogladius sp.]|nr:triphosphoribosyl-dephospho-CoA synthase [Thermogladius sp.]
MTSIRFDSLEYYSTLLSYSIALEASAYPKPGNTHRLSEYPDKPYLAFILNSMVFQRAFEEAARKAYMGQRVGVGEVVYNAVSPMMRYSGFNTSLGQALLLAPLAISIGRCLREAGEAYGCFVEYYTSVVEETSVEDSILFYKSVRLAAPSYLKIGDETGDFVNVWDPEFEAKLRAKRHRLVDVLRFSSERDIVASEVVSGLSRSKRYMGELENYLSVLRDWNKAVVATFLEIMGNEIDTLIARRHGLDTAVEVSRRARLVKEFIGRPGFESEVRALDQYLRERGLNPGSLADILTSTIALFLLKNGLKPVFAGITES